MTNSFMWKVNKLPVHKDTQDILVTVPRCCAWNVHGLSQSLKTQPHNSINNIFKIIVYAIMVSQGYHEANMGPLHGACMLSYCTSYQQLVKMSFQNLTVTVCNASFQHQTVF